MSRSSAALRSALLRGLTACLGACLCTAAACGSANAPDPFVTQGTGHWEPTAQAPPNATTASQLFWTGKEVLVPSSTGVFEYDPAARRWAPFDGMAFNYANQNYASQNNVALAWTGTSLVAFGYSNNIDNGNVLTATSSPVAVSYDVATGVLKNISLQGAPSIRAFCDVLWTGTRVLVWGGGADKTDANGVITAYEYSDGGLYDPASDSWTPIHSSPLSPPRSAESAVWTGSEMLIWGGEFGPAVDVLPPTGTTAPPSAPMPATPGVAYNPTTATWRAMSTMGQPRPRAAHTAIWTGTEMIIWGGDGYFNAQSSDTVLADGAAYNPVTDTWRPIRPAPETGLYEAASVWTGTEMIVWGGKDKYGPGYSSRGYRYTPATDSWQYLTTVGAPAPRLFPGGTWTGRSLVVWGGLAFGDFAPWLTDGAQWFPEAADGG